VVVKVFQVAWRRHPSVRTQLSGGSLTAVLGMGGSGQRAEQREVGGGLGPLVALASAVARHFGRCTHWLPLDRELAGSYAAARSVGAGNVAAYVIVSLVRALGFARGR
jgi:hypothetical protein